MDFLRALGFLTLLPVPSIPCDTGDLGRSSPWFPLVGAVIGAILAGEFPAVQSRDCMFCDYQEICEGEQVPYSSMKGDASSISLR